MSVDEYLQTRDGEKPLGVYALYDAHNAVQYIGYSRNMVLAVKVLYSPCSCHSSASFNQACHSMHHQLCHHDPAPYMLCTSCLQTCGSKHFKSFPLYFYRIICKGLVKQNVLLSEPWSLPMQPWPPGQILRGRCTAGLIGRVSFLQAMAPKKICGM